LPPAGAESLDFGRKGGIFGDSPNVSGEKQSKTFAGNKPVPSWQPVKNAAGH
jgi:hypothetical protein